MKQGQLEKLAEARDDPSFAQQLVTKDLSPEQETSQIALRAAVAEVQARLAELDAGLAFLRDRRTHDATLGRTVADVETSILDRQKTIDDLSRRLHTVKIGSSSRAEPSAYKEFLNPLPSFLAFKTASSMRVPPNIQAEVQAAVDKQSARASLMGRLRKRGTRIVGEGAVGNAENIVHLDSVLPPRAPRSQQEDVKPDVAPPRQSSPNVAVPSEPAPPASFSGFSIKLDPPATTSPTSSGRSHGGVERGGGRKKVEAAAKYVPTASAPSPSTSGFSFGLPTAVKSETPAAQPKGFFSFGS